MAKPWGFSRVLSTEVLQGLWEYRLFPERTATFIKWHAI